MNKIIILLAIVSASSIGITSAYATMIPFEELGDELVRSDSSNWYEFREYAVGEHGDIEREITLSNGTNVTYILVMK